MLEITLPTAEAAENVLEMETVGWLIQTTDNPTTRVACPQGKQKA